MKHLTLLSLPCVALIAGCSGTGAQHQPVVDGTPSAAFQSDLTACQSVAKSRRWDNAETRQNVMLGTAMGAALGAADKDGGTALGGAVAGALATTLGGAVKSRDARRHIVVTCMQQRGHRVVG
ncbi:glycine zipper family protein [Sulfitobacter mediterraneus]|uniref:Glycine zipper family protein n=1 Tax=Sulfitobacter mediterraneus TaxID=83219 RepID=A0A061SRE5_9RHOB|nr:glycine zipper family protein [Sulfitobacter mediterraneus]KAJ01820.1 hypothetical protein PM02_16980 [Sulfitobacter mediterraneus]